MIKIERMTSEDYDIYRPDLDVFEDATWVRELFSNFIDDPYAYFYKAYFNDVFAGYCGMYHNTMNTEHFCKIMDLKVKPEFRRKGVANALMLEVLDMARKLELNGTKLEVDIRNGAIELYKSLGFTITDTEEGFYDDGGAAYIMWRYERKI